VNRFYIAETSVIVAPSIEWARRAFFRTHKRRPKTTTLVKLNEAQLYDVESGILVRRPVVKPIRGRPRTITKAVAQSH